MLKIRTYRSTDLQQDLTSIRNWCFNNSLLINPDKTKLIVFGTKQMDGKMFLSLSRSDLKDLFPTNFVTRRKLWDLLNIVVS